MEEKKLNHSRPEHKLKLFTMGLNIEVQPYWLIKGMINENSQNILDEIITSKFRECLKAFKNWEDGVIQSIGDQDPDVVFVTHKHKEHIQQIQDVADMSRHLLPLHSDWECAINDEDQDIIDRAYQYWKYNEFYGHEI